MKNLSIALLAFVSCSTLFAGDYICHSTEKNYPLTYFIHTKTNVDDDNIFWTDNKTPSFFMVSEDLYGAYYAEQEYQLQFFNKREELVVKTTYLSTYGSVNTRLVIETRDAQKNVVSSQSLKVLCKRSS